jgi:hypothetical protein
MIRDYSLRSHSQTKFPFDNCPINTLLILAKGLPYRHLYLRRQAGGREILGKNIGKKQEIAL